MNATDIICIAKSDPIMEPFFGGVFPADLLLNVKPSYPCGIVVNTDPHDKPGKHWVAFYFNENGKGEFFDSYGYPPQHYHTEWHYWLQQHSISWVFNRRKIQSMFSAACGLHCLFFLYHRCLGLSMEQVQQLYTYDRVQNDRIAEEDLEQHTRKDIVIDNLDYIINQLCTSLA